MADGLDRLWAGWRTAYIQSTGDPAVLGPDDDGRSLFERILHSGLPDQETHILWRGDHCFAILNAYPYGSRHQKVQTPRAEATQTQI